MPRQSGPDGRQQGAILFNDPKTTEVFQEYSRGIRVRSLTQLVWLGMALNVEYHRKGQLFQRFCETSEVPRTFDNFVYSITVKDAAAILNCADRKAWEYLEVLKKVGCLFA